MEAAADGRRGRWEESTCQQRGRKERRGNLLDGEVRVQRLVAEKHLLQLPDQRLDQDQNMDKSQ